MLQSMPSVKMADMNANMDKDFKENNNGIVSGSDVNRGK